MNNLYNINIERAILSAIIYDPELVPSIVLKYDDFYLPFYQQIFKTIKVLHKDGNPIEEEFIKKSLIENNQFDEVAMLELLAANPITNVEAYQDTLIELSNKRKILQLQQYIKENIDNLSSNEILSLLTREHKVSQSYKGLPPIYDIRSVEPNMPEFWLKNFLPIPKEEITLLSAGGGSGKSFLTLLIGLMMNQEHQLKVFGWFSEDTVYTTSHRNELLKNIYPKLTNTAMSIGGKETSPKAFVMKSKGGYRATDFFYNLKGYLKDFDVIILDPLIAFFGEDENSNTEASFFLGLLNEWCVEEHKSILLIHHHNKEDKFRGASSFVNSVRMHYSLKKLENNEEDRQIIMEKTNHWKGDKTFKIKLFAGEYGTKQPSNDSHKKIHKKPSDTSFKNNTLDIVIEPSMPHTDEEKKLRDELKKQGFNFE